MTKITLKDLVDAKKLLDDQPIPKAPTVNYMQNLLEDLRSNLDGQLKSEVKKCLESKGYDFESDYHFIKFIQEKCRMEIFHQSGERILFAEGKPFFRWIYDFKIEYKKDTVYGSYGSFQWL